ncbi:MAG: type II secretion system F family protein [Candidatus Woesearchaeota archaeon]
MVVIRLIHLYVKKFPELKRKLKTAHIDQSPEVFVKKALKSALTLSMLLAVVMFFFLSSFEKPLWHLAYLFPLLFLVFFWFMSHTPDVHIRRRQKDIEKDILFAGRFILVKIESGEPFFNALTDASKARGASAKYFKEIVDEVNLGTPIEKALDNAIEYSPSENFRRVLMQVNNALKTGIDVAGTLRNILKQIAEEQIIEIKEYGKKLNSIAMFYLLIGVVVPALGVTMFIVVSSFFSLQIKFRYLLFVAFLLMFLQFIFISMFKSIRPMVEI